MNIKEKVIYGVEAGVYKRGPWGAWLPASGNILEMKDYIINTILENAKLCISHEVILMENAEFTKFKC